MQRWDRLSERQLGLLRRIADGDDLSGPDGVSQRNSARALQSRRLVQVSRKGGVWRAQITEAGTFYLHHGYHPDHPDRLATAASPARIASSNANGATIQGTRASSALVEQATALMERLERDGGTVQVESPNTATRAQYRRIIHAVKQNGLVPAGFHLLHTGRDRGDIVIRLSADDHPDETDWNRIRLNTRRVTSDPAVVFTALENDPAGLDVTEASVPRALDLLRGLAAEAALRGHRLGVNTRTKHPKVYLQLGQTRRTVTLTEEYDQVRHVPTEQERRELRRNPWMRGPEHEEVPSGRLRLEVARAGWNRYDTWTDDKRTSLEIRLRQIIRDVEAGIAADEQARLAAQRAAEEIEAQRRREEEETRQRWRAAMAEARVNATEKLRKDAFGKAFDAWTAAEQIRAFCTALERAGNPDRGENLACWIAWGRTLADRIDPTRDSNALANAPFDIEPEPDDLRPFLGDWSPHRPGREYRSERDEKQLADIRIYAREWHPGHAWPAKLMAKMKRFSDRHQTDSPERRHQSHVDKRLAVDVLSSGIV